MTDEQKIEQAAEAYATGNHRASFPDGPDMKAFTAGVTWRDANPPPLPEDLAKVRDEMVLPDRLVCDHCGGTRQAQFGFDTCHALLDTSENTRLKAALTKCREQRDGLVSWNAVDDELHEVELMNQEIDAILKGEV